MSLSSPVLAGVFGLGGPELLLIFAVLLLLFGATKLPALAKGLGQSVKEFKKAAKEGDDDEKPAAKKPDDGNDPSKLRNN